MASAEKLIIDNILHKFNISLGINININIVKFSTLKVIEKTLDKDISTYKYDFI